MKKDDDNWVLYLSVGLIIMGFFLGMLRIENRLTEIEHKMQMHGWEKP